MNEHSTAGRMVSLQGRALDQLMPMHIWFGPGGQINRAGPTMIRLVGDGALTGRNVFDLVEMRRPRLLTTVAGLLALDGQRLNMRLKALPDLPLRGQIQSLPAGTGGLLNVSLGLSFAEAVERRGLTLGDFAPVDQTVELLYLREAIQAVAAESRKLTDRLIAAERAAEARASSDALTGLANRRALSTALDVAIAQRTRNFSLMHIDLDFFKQVNDQLGHAAGDEVLKRVAKVLQDETREGDIPARVGGDEFVLLIQGCEDPETLDRIAKRIVKRLSTPMTIEGKPCKIGASIGTTCAGLYPEPDAEQMLRDADEALYASKRQGRGRHNLFDGQGQSFRVAESPDQLLSEPLDSQADPSPE